MKHKSAGVLILAVALVLGNIANAQQQSEFPFYKYFDFFKYFSHPPQNENPFFSHHKERPDISTPERPTAGTPTTGTPTTGTSDKKDPCTDGATNNSSTPGTSPIGKDDTKAQPGLVTSTACPQIGTTPPLAAGGRHTCAVLNGVVNCWGSNEFGQLGVDGKTVTSNVPVKVNVAGKIEVTGLTAGKFHTCMLLKDKTIQCWGKNDFGQLGVDSKTTATSNVPVAVNLKDVVNISAGSSHTCAQQSDGTVWCWGKNDLGQLGADTTTTPKSDIPVKVMEDAAGTAFIATNISAGNAHTCAVAKKDASVRCWGSNVSEQLGVDKISNSSLPLAVKDSAGKPLADIVSVSAGGSHTCVVTKSNTSLCWGSNDSGQLAADPKVTPYSSAPVTVAGAAFNRSSSGGSHTCERLTDGTIACFGAGLYGQLGNGKNDDSQFAVTPVAGLQGVTALSAGLYHTCVMINAKDVKCWGNNKKYGQLGDGTNDDRNIPTAIAPSQP